MSTALRYTAYGVPHIEADSFHELGFGIAWAQAEQYLDSLAQRWLTVRGQRSQYFGAEGAVGDGPQPSLSNLRSDLWWQRMRTSAALTAPEDEDLCLLIEGYVAGYNSFIEEHPGRSRIPTFAITAEDIYARALHWNIFRSSGAMIDPLTQATPPGCAQNPPAADFIAPPQESNMVMFGRETTAHGGGMMFTNPHWYWQGPDSFREIHLTIPGVLDVYGSTVPGIPLIMTGFNADLAFAGTSSFSQRFCLYRLELVPGHPTRYLFDGAEREMVRESVSVRTKTGEVTHDFWTTVHGPVIHSERFPWTSESAYALADVALSIRWLSQQWALMKAASIDEVDAATRRYMAVGWRNLMLVTREGEAFYADRTAVPHLSDAQLDDAFFEPDSGVKREIDAVPVLDGTRRDTQWGNDADAPVPGIYGASSLPSLRRYDYLANQNDSHWLNNPRRRLEGFPRVLGPERSPRTLRTRFALTRIEDLLDGGGSVRDAAHIRELLFDSPVFSARLWKDDLIALLHTQGEADAAEVLQAWDGTETIGARGAVLWRAFFFAFCEDHERIDVSRFATPFDVDDPLNTPAGLAVQDVDRVLGAVRAARHRLVHLGLPLDAAVEDVQYLRDGAERIPISGGPGAPGQYNLVEPRDVPVGDITPSEVGYGTGFLLWVDYTPAGPRAESLVVYSQNEDPASAHHRDQTRLYAAGKTKPVFFTPEEVRRKTLRERHWPSPTEPDAADDVP